MSSLSPTLPSLAPLPEQALLIDVRSYSEYMSGHVPGARCIPLPQLAEQIAHLAPDRATPIILYCASGARSEQALGLLQQQGYTEAYNGGGAVQLAERLRCPLERGL
ncbi:rhodanese-like domain-containing protein [Paucibacter sp. PLA-PC-4]|uniref:rhodanese-like domain-containing protein n=1 Tax=Paucibacter sp. PLA-PC-4 TaxID=2993655 RepID=UPI0022499103|nr:rhodanese-like domain-containing protein [Paucibacter sp. PLA-PC-4]MCX2862936.1 rhodanese-like domain-containing protein [Paucibacter sp. PLA-PC-4]